VNSRWRVLLLVGACLLSRQGLAQPTASFSAERLNTPAGGAGLVVCESAAIPGHGVLLFDLLVSTAHRPVVLSLREGIAKPEVMEPVRQVTSFQLSAALELWQRLRLGVVVPFLSLAGDRLQGLGEDRDFASLSAGDLRLQATVVLWSGRSLPLAVALSPVFSLPTGDDSSFAGSGVLAIMPRLLLLSRPLPWLGVMGQVGAAVHSQQEFYGNTWGRRLFWALGLDLGLSWLPPSTWVSRHLSLLAEADGESCFDCESDGPLELRGGLRLRWERWQATISGGGGIGDGVTVPAWRLTAGVGLRLNGLVSGAKAGGS